MGPLRADIIPIVFAGIVVLALSQKWLRDAILEGLNNFRGGPPTPMHPSPSDDRGLLNRKRDRPAKKPAH